MSAENELSYSILNLCDDGSKEIFKSLEKNVVKLTMHNSHLSFNETALNNCLLPNYTNVKLYDDVAREEEFVHDFRNKMLVREISKQK